MTSAREVGVGILLAAGSGSRFHGPSHKLLAEVDGRAVVSFAIDALKGAELDYKVVVCGSVDLSALIPPEFSVLDNPLWERGMATSLQVGVSYARRLRADFVIVGLGDQPFITASTWTKLARITGEKLVVATYDGMPRNPVRIDRSLFDRLPKYGDEGARQLIHENSDSVCYVECEGSPFDIDTLEDLGRWR